MQTTVFGILPDGRTVREYTLENKNFSVSFISWAGAIRKFVAWGRDIICGFDTLEDYLTDTSHQGALVGRYANRIADGRFTLNGTEYPLPANDGPNHLHGGPGGFDRQVWTVEALTDRSAVLALRSPHGQEGYPGTLDVRAAYTLTDGGLTIDYQARCDRDTVCNLTNHSYFNLSGHGSGPVGGQ